MYVIKSLQCQIDASKHVHSLLRGTCRVPVSPLNAALDHGRLYPDVIVQIENAQVVQRHLAVPPAENVHVVLVYHCSVTKSNLGLGQKSELLRDDSLVDHCFVFF